jgi:FxsC-like protein
MIVEQAKAYPLPVSRRYSSIDEIRSPFAQPIGQGDQDLPADNRDGTANPGPNTASFAFAAGSKDELRRVRGDVDAYGPRGGHDWRPYRGQSAEEIGRQAVDDGGFIYEDLPIADDFLERLGRAKDQQKVVVVVVDPWTIQLEFYRQKMLDFDRRESVSSGLLIPWDDEDAETARARYRLELGVERTFRQRFALNPAYVGSSIHSADELQKELAAAINEVRSRIIRGGAVQRGVEGRVPLPRNSGPGTLR